MYGQAGNTFKNRLSDEERADHFNDPKTEIGKKRVNAEMILNARKNYREKTEEYIKKYFKGNISGNKSLDGIAAFLTGKEEKDRSLAAEYLSREMDPSAHLKTCIEMFLKFPLKNLDISSEA